MAATRSYKEEYKLTARMDANNLFPQARWYNTVSDPVNFSSSTQFGSSR